MKQTRREFLRLAFVAAVGAILPEAILVQEQGKNPVEEGSSWVSHDGVTFEPDFDYSRIADTTHYDWPAGAGQDRVDGLIDGVELLEDWQFVSAQIQQLEQWRLMYAHDQAEEGGQLSRAIWVMRDGNDDNSGLLPTESKKPIAALEELHPGDVFNVSRGIIGSLR